MSEEFKDSDTQAASKTLLIAVGGTTGSGKTESALRIARGIGGDNIGLIDTENRRALNKKDRYRFAHLDMQAPYSPEHFQSLIQKSIAAGHKVTIVDSWSAEWDEEGGLSDQAEIALERMSKGNSELASKLTGLAWKEPKRAHKAFMRWIRKTEHPVIFCLRAEPKIKYQKDEKGKTQVIDAGWLPITEKLFGYDMLIYALMMPENPGVPVHLKKLEPYFEPMFPIGKQVTEKSGQMLAAWASGAPKAAQQNPEQATAGAGTPSEQSSAVAAPTITVDQAIELGDLFRERKWNKDKFFAKHGIKSFEQVTVAQYEQAKAAA